MKIGTSNNTPDKAFSVNTDAIQKCDIILTKYSLLHNGTLRDYYSLLQSSTIKLATNGNYSHAILCLSKQSIIEADRDGVHTNNLMRLSWNDPSDFNIFRLNRPLTEDEILKISDFARSRHGVIYSVRGAVASALKITEDNHAEFCSRLVARAFAYAGINLVENPDNATPADLEHSQLLIQCNYKKVIYMGQALSELIEVNRDSPLDLQKDIVTNLYKGIRSKIASNVMNEEDIMHYLWDLPEDEFIESDQKITEITDASYYPYMFSSDYSRNPESYDSKLCLEKNFNQTEMYFYDQISGASDQLRVHSMMFEIYKNSYRKGYFRILMLTLYSNLIKQDTRRRNTYIETHQKIYG